MRYIGKQLAHDIELMIARENQARLFAVLLLQMDEFLNNIHHTVFLKDLFPQIGGRISVGVCRIALAAIFACTVTALIERKKICILSGELRCHPHLGVVNGEVAQNPFVELETDFARVAVIHPLPLGVIDGLPGVLIFQFKGKYGNTVEHEHHIHTLFTVRAVVPLTVNSDMVARVLRRRRLIQGGFGLEVADAEGDAAVLEAVAEHMEQARHVAGIVERVAELFDGVDLVGIRKPRPLLGLCLLDKVNQGIDEQPELWIVGIFAFDITAVRREQSRFNISFKAFFVGFVNWHLNHHQSSI